MALGCLSVSRPKAPPRFVCAMSVCEFCDNLHGLPFTVLPHADLEMFHRSTDGAGALERYRCVECAAVWEVFISASPWRSPHEVWRRVHHINGSSEAGRAGASAR